MIERKIIIGFITCTEFCKEVFPLYKPEYIESNTAREIARWCKEYYDKYSKAPQADIETIYYAKLEEGLTGEIAEEFEEDILPSLSKEYVDEGLDDYLFDETIKHFQEVQYKYHAEELLDTIEDSKMSKELRLSKISTLLGDFKPLQVEKDSSIALHGEGMELAMKKAFENVSKPVVVFPKELGEFWNDQMVEGSLIGILAPEKRGKSWLLLEIAMRAARQGKNIIMYQAGDMNEDAQLKRIAIYLSRNSNQEKYCMAHLQPVRDCICNQANTCVKKERECTFGIGKALESIRNLTIQDYKDILKEYPDYEPCHNCTEWKDKRYGAPWFKQVEPTTPITVDDAVQVTSSFFGRYNSKFILSTHANGTLSPRDIEEDLKKRYDKDGFIPHLILIDYADLLAPISRGEYRQQQNEIWKYLRKISQTPVGGVLPLVITPTQTDSAAYKQHSLSLNNYSEDKRKYSHVTAFYGLNQDPKGREKGLSMLRIGELLLREGEFSAGNQITLLQDLRIGRPYIGAFWGGDNRNNEYNNTEE